jgi:hypothetical protein
MAFGIRFADVGALTVSRIQEEKSPTSLVGLSGDTKKGSLHVNVLMLLLA